MISAGREGFDLFHKYGRYYFFRRGIFGDKWARKFVLQDTFGRFICALIGHAKTFKTEEGQNCCYRCYKIKEK